MMLALTKSLNYSALASTGVIPWSSPIPAFGNPANAHIATLGINPSNLEFEDAAGNELTGVARRFHTLNSLGLSSWQDAQAKHLEDICQLCCLYFRRNPYDAWFGKLDYIVSGMGASYYGSAGTACHLDLVPYATSEKWTNLKSNQQLSLFNTSGEVLGILLRDNPIRVLVLNGSAVVQQFERFAPASLEKTPMSAWTLPRKKGIGVAGFGYRGMVRSVAGVWLDKELLVLGYNHNIQSSYGVSREVMLAIRDWIARCAMEKLI